MKKLYLITLLPLLITGCVKKEPTTSSSISSDSISVPPVSPCSINSEVESSSNNSSRSPLGGLKDRDFDGIDDDIDKDSNSNTFLGHIRYANEVDDVYETDVSYKLDYRDFINKSNTRYNKDFSKLGIILATNAYPKGMYVAKDPVFEVEEDKERFSIYKEMGLKDIEYHLIDGNDYEYDQLDETSFYIGHHKVEYNSEETEVIFLTIAGTFSDTQWTSNVDIGAKDISYYEKEGENHPDWLNEKNHKGFDVAANRVLSKVRAYIEAKVTNTLNKIIFISGHSRGGSIAGILGKDFEGNKGFKSFTYTYAAPVHTTDTTAKDFKSIFNVVNADDLVVHLMSTVGLTRYGTDVADSINLNYINEFKTVTTQDYQYLTGLNDFNEAFKVLASDRVDLYTINETKLAKELYEKTLEGVNADLDEFKSKVESYGLTKYFKYSEPFESIEHEGNIAINTYNCGMGIVAFLVDAINANVEFGLNTLVDLTNMFPNYMENLIAPLLSFALYSKAFVHGHVPISYYIIADNHN